MRIVSVLRLMSICTPFTVENTAPSPMFSRRKGHMELENKSTTSSSGYDRVDFDQVSGVLLLDPI